MAELPAQEIQLVNLRKQLERQHTEHLLWLLNGLRDRLGEQVADAVNAIVAHDVTEDWKATAEREGSNTIEDLIRLLWEPLVEKGFKYTYEKTDKGYQMCLTHCPIAELAKELDAKDWLYALHCATDPFSTVGFNPKVEFRRTKTLMEGDDYCDHFYAFPKARRHSANCGVSTG